MEQRDRSYAADKLLDALIHSRKRHFLLTVAIAVVHAAKAKQKNARRVDKHRQNGAFIA